MTTLQRVRRRFIEPSSKITEPGERRQAALLSTFLLAIIILAVGMEVGTVTLLWGEPYTGYRQTIMAVSFLFLAYRISRTQHVHLAAILSVIIISFAIFLSAWVQPEGILGGMLDFLIVPLWLASLYLRFRTVTLLILFDMLAMLALPWFVPAVELHRLLIGPFSFLFATSIVLMVITRHRNLLEQDRRAELVEKEMRSRREAVRAEALLRVAEHLNTQLDLDTLLKSICEEVTRTLDTPVSLVGLYDPKQSAFHTITGVGISPDVIKSLAPSPVDLHSQKIKNFGTFTGLQDQQSLWHLPNLELFKKLGLHSLAFAMMEYEGEIIGNLTAISQNENRPFSEDELLLLHGLAHQAALAIANTRLFKDARRRLEHLQALRAIDVAIASNFDLHETLDVLLKQITTQLGVDAAVILLMDETGQQLKYGAGQGFRTSALRFTCLRMGEGIAGRAAQQSQIVHIRDLHADPQSLAHAPALAMEGFVSYYAAPLRVQGKVKGVLEIFHRSLLDSDAEWLGFLEALAGQAAIAIENTSLVGDLQRSNEELSKAYDSTIEGWSRALDLRDRETEGHTRRVTELSLELARSFGFSEAELVQIRRGALLHDIGKMGVPDSILLKEGELTAEEWEVMRKHPDLAHELLLPISYLRPALDIPYCHHEKWDGSGYPRGLKGEEIPLTARIFAVVDVWDAMTSSRPYRTARAPEDVLPVIRSKAGKHFDPQVVEAFVDLLERKAERKEQVSKLTL